MIIKINKTNNKQKIQLVYKRMGNILYSKYYYYYC